MFLVKFEFNYLLMFLLFSCVSSASLQQNASQVCIFFLFFKETFLQNLEFWLQQKKKGGKKMCKFLTGYETWIEGDISKHSHPLCHGNRPDPKAQELGCILLVFVLWFYTSHRFWEHGLQSFNT